MKKVTDLTKNEVIQCNTEEEADAVCKLMHQSGLSWSNGDSYSDVTRFRNYKGKPVGYVPNKGTFSKIEYFLSDSDLLWKIHQASEFLSERISEEPEKPIDKVTTDLLHQALVICGIEISPVSLDNIIDVVELLEEKGAKVTLEELNELKKSW